MAGKRGAGLSDLLGSVCSSLAGARDCFVGDGRAARRAERRRLSETERGYVFSTSLGNAIDPRNFNRSFKRRCRLAGVREVRVHDTRHTCGTLLAALDVHPRVAMQIVRHSKIAVTMEIYTHAPTAKTIEALRQLGE